METILSLLAAVVLIVMYYLAYKTQRKTQSVIANNRSALAKERLKSRRVMKRADQ